MATNTTPLPSTIDDIQSDRGTNLSPEELDNLRSLIGIAKSGNLDNKNRVKNNEPLSNRRVMVPVTSKAL